jgi:hypothetical protein
MNSYIDRYFSLIFHDFFGGNFFCTEPGMKNKNLFVENG